MKASLPTIISQLSRTIECAMREIECIEQGTDSKWRYDQVHDVVLPEMREILTHAQSGEIFFKYGKKQRLLESAYILTDSLEDLTHTDLGAEIHILQELLFSYK